MFPSAQNEYVTVAEFKHFIFFNLKFSNITIEHLQSKLEKHYKFTLLISTLSKHMCGKKTKQFLKLIWKSCFYEKIRSNLFKPNHMVFKNHKGYLTFYNTSCLVYRSDVF